MRTRSTSPTATKERPARLDQLRRLDHWAMAFTMVVVPVLGEDSLVGTLGAVAVAAALLIAVEDMFSKTVGDLDACASEPFLRRFARIVGRHRCRWLPTCAPDPAWVDGPVDSPPGLDSRFPFSGTCASLMTPWPCSRIAASASVGVMPGSCAASYRSIHAYSRASGAQDPNTSSTVHERVWKRRPSPAVSRDRYAGPRVTSIAQNAHG